MKKRIILTLVIVCLLACVTVFCVSALTGGASNVSLEIKAGNLTFGNSIYIDYAVAATGVDVEAVELLIWDKAQNSYLKGSEKYSYGPTSGTKTIDDTVCRIFTFDDIVAKQLADDFYAVAYAKVGETEYYSAPIKYSVLRYAYSKLGLIPGAPSDNENYKALLTEMLEYGAAVQTNFNYNTGRLADEKYYLVSVDGGRLPDGFNWGLYKEKDKVVITASATDSEGGVFAGWLDSNGSKVYADASVEIEVGAKNETYTAKYVKYSQGLEFDSNGDTTCCLIGMGDCEDAELVIPPVSPDGDKVTEIDSSAFAGEALVGVSFPNTITSIGRKAFNGCTSITNVYYDGSAADWENVSIGSNNDPILNANMHFSVVATYTVTFVDWDGTVLSTVNVSNGAAATAPKAPSRDGYTFTGWDKAFGAVTEDITVMATYTANSIDPTFIVESITASASDTVTLRIKVRNNPGILGMVLQLQYDESAMTLTGAANGEALSVLTMTPSNILESGCKFAWDAVAILEENIADGDILVLTFAIADDATAGTYAVTVSYNVGDIFNNDMVPLTFDIENGKVIIQ